MNSTRQSAQEWILLFLIANLFILLPIVEWAFLQKSLWSAGILLIGIIQYQEKVRWKLDWWDFLLAIFVAIQFIWFCFAQNQTLIWSKALFWLLLWLAMILIKHIDTSQFKLRTWGMATWIFATYNMVALSSFFLWLVLTSPGQDFNPIDLQRLATVFGYNPNYVSTLLALAIPLLVWWNRHFRIHGLLYTSLLILHISFIVLLNSRGAILALLGIGIYLFFSRKTLNKLPLRFMALSSLTIFLAIFFMAEKPLTFIKTLSPTSSLSAHSNDDRMVLWKNSLQLVKENPLLGVGTGQWSQAISRFGYTDLNYSLDRGWGHRHAHNFFIETAVEFGLPLTLLIISILFWGVLKYLRSKSLLPIGASLLAFIICASFYGVAYPYQLEMPGPTVIAFLLLAVIQKKYLKKSHAVGAIGLDLLLLLLALVCLRWHTFEYNQRELHGMYTENMQSSQFKEAKTHLDKLYSNTFARFYQNIPIDHMYADLYWRLKNHPEAINRAKNATIRAPGCAACWHHLGNMYRTRQEWKLADEAYSQAYAINKNYRGVIVARAEVSLKLKDWETLKIAQKLYDYLEPIFANNKRTKVSELQVVENFWIRQEKFFHQLRPIFEGQVYPEH